MTRTVTINDRMQRGYRYELTAAAGRAFDPDFAPELTPAEMPRMGVLAGGRRAPLRSGRLDLPPAPAPGPAAMGL